jgi:superoxide dismutase, Cu-Zn family
MLKLTLLTVLIAACYVQSAPTETSSYKFPIKAVSVLTGMIMPKGVTMEQFMTGMVDPQNPIVFISGRVSFFQDKLDGDVLTKINITFSAPVDGSDKRGLHIHAFGISTQSENVTEVCGSTGPHFNPKNETHGSLTSTVRHIGDLGNVVINDDGKILGELTIPSLRLYGKDSIVGRSVVLHEKVDDEGKGSSPLSKTTGDAGARIACGSIVLEKA